jgi:AAA family ATP:ADP antiporter
VAAVLSPRRSAGPFRVLFEIRPEERRNTFAAFGTLLAITTGHTLLETGRDALFLSKLPTSYLPWLYLLIAVIALGLARLGRFGGRNRGKLIVSWSLVVAAAVTAAFWARARTDTTPSMLFALYLWSGLFASWVTLQFWTLLGRAHTMTQAKRLYGFIGAGAVLGAVLGALLARAILIAYPPHATLLLAAALFLVASFPAMALRVAPAVAEQTSRDARRRGSMSAGFTALWQNAFARRVLGIAFVSTVTFTFVDFFFKSTLAARYGRDVGSLAAYLSTFYAVTNVLSLVAQLVVAPWAVRALGVQRALLFFPLAVASGAVFAIVTGASFASAVAVKGIDGAFRYSVHKTSSELLLVPVPDGTRERLKPIIDLVGTRGGQAAASVGILLLVAVGVGRGPIGGVPVGAIVVLLLAAIWLGMVVTIRRLYLDVFRETLKSGGLSGKAELPELDLGALETLFAGLNSDRDLEVLASLDLLAEQHRDRLIPALILYHPSRKVVLRALEIFTERGRDDFVPIADRLNDHSDGEVAAAALRARTRVAPDRKLLRTRLSDDCPEVAATALVALLARQWISPTDADPRIDDIVKQRSWRTAVELARSIRDAAATRTDPAIDERFDSLLVRLAGEAPLFADHERAPVIEGGASIVPPGMFPAPTPDVQLSLEVARAMAARRSERFLPVLVGMLGRHELRVTAREAVVQIPGALAYLDRAMDDPTLARGVRLHLPRTMTRIDPENASRLLVPRILTEKQGAVRFRTLRALVKARQAMPSLRLDDAGLRRALESTLDRATKLGEWAQALAGSDKAPPSITRNDPLQAAHHLLLDLARDKETHATQRIFFLLELLRGEPFDDIARGLRSKDPKTRASSLELIENLVESPYRERVLALAEDAPRRRSSLGYEDALHEIATGSGVTMRTLAEYRAAELGIVLPETGARPSQPPSTESIGRRLIERAREALKSEPVEAGGTRAPA